MESQSWAAATEIEEYPVMSLEILPKAALPEIILPTSKANYRDDTKESLNRIIDTIYPTLRNSISSFNGVPYNPQPFENLTRTPLRSLMTNLDFLKSDQILVTS